MKLYTDNQGALRTIVSGITMASTKHIDVRYHNSRDLHREGLVTFTYVPSGDNPADIATKALAAPKH
jgi:hypothetical protein